MIRRSAAGVFQLWLSLLACISHALSATSVVLINDDNSEVMALWAIRQALQDPQNALATWDKNYISPCTFAYIQCSAEQVVIRVDLPNEQLGGSLSPHFAGLPNLQYLMLQNNNISGPIPWELGNLTQLVSLDLSSNNLTGSIPNTLRNLKSLTYLNLNNNKLTGGFPVFLSSITGLSILNLSNNNLAGFVPNVSFPNFSVQGNPRLCGATIKRECLGDAPLPLAAAVNVSETYSAPAGQSSKGPMASGLALGGAVLVAAVALAVLWRQHNSNRQSFFDVVNEQQEPDVPLGQLKKFHFRDLQVATGNFDSKNLLGQGGFGNVYKGCLTDGSLVAVKRLKGQGSAAAELQFQMEVEIISLAVHRNLLRLRGFCMTPTERLLVYPFMSNGSVASRLRETNIHGKPALDWSTRKRIALGSARGLLYMHEHCDPKIIHRDVKAANILLDEDFEAVVGDFGLAKLLDHCDSHVTTAVRGTVGHIAPEYLSTGQSSEKTDVFGYGVLLLELITGQRAFEFDRLSRHNNMLLLDWVKKCQAEKRLDLLVDVDLKNDYNRMELEEIVQVALLCSQTSPSERPKMSDVVRMLEGEGLVERWEKWWEAEKRRSLEAPSMPHWELIHDSSWDIEATQLSGPR